MREDGNPDPHHSEKLMFARAGIQALTATLVAVALVTAE
jgi:hypothetical protein